MHTIWITAHLLADSMYCVCLENSRVIVYYILIKFSLFCTPSCKKIGSQSTHSHTDIMDPNPISQYSCMIVFFLMKTIYCLMGLRSFGDRCWVVHIRLRATIYRAFEIIFLSKNIKTLRMFIIYLHVVQLLTVFFNIFLFVVLHNNLILKYEYEFTMFPLK
jgi:hypothetical protein